MTGYESLRIYICVLTALIMDVHCHYVGSGLERMQFTLDLFPKAVGSLNGELESNPRNYVHIDESPGATGRLMDVWFSWVEAVEASERIRG